MALGHAAHTHNSRRPMHNLKRGNSRDTRKSRDNRTSKGQPQSAEAHAANSHNPLQRLLACYNCGEPRHTAPNCTKPRKVPPRNTNKANSASGTNSSDSNINGRDTKAVVCSAMAIQLEQRYPTWHVINYSKEPTWPCPGPGLNPIMEMDFDWVQLQKKPHSLVLFFWSITMNLTASMKGHYEVKSCIGNITEITIRWKMVYGWWLTVTLSSMWIEKLQS